MTQRGPWNIAETEKYAHITYFFNGGREIVFPGEDRVLIPSPKVATYDSTPLMSAKETTDKLLDAISSNKYSFLLINFANADMLGHTGNIPATIKAVEFVDSRLKMIVNSASANNYNLFITADHGNAEEMLVDEQVNDEHTTNPVPFIFCQKAQTSEDLGFGTLADIAPTILYTMKLTPSEEMTGKNLLKQVYG